jgi:SmpA/OmlA family protein
LVYSKSIEPLPKQIKRSILIGEGVYLVTLGTDLSCRVKTMKFLQRIRRACKFVGIATLFLLVGCSSFIALSSSGVEPPDLGVIQVGATRNEIELELGSPISTKVFDDDTVMDTYKYKWTEGKAGAGPLGIGRDLSPKKRAWYYFIFNLFTLGQGEQVLMDHEWKLPDNSQDYSQEITILYDKNDRLISFQKMRKRACLNLTQPWFLNESCDRLESQPKEPEPPGNKFDP